MKKYYLKNQIYPLILSFIFFTSCNGQVKTNLPKDSSDSYLDEPKALKESHPKMIRTQGIMSGNVGCELQDKAGNIWFSTGGQGVYRYDGKSFTNYTTKDGLCNNDVSAIIEDKAGNILFGTKSGICKYDGKSFSKYAELDILSKIGINCLLEDRDGNLWFGTMTNGVYRYDGKNLTNFLNNDDYPFNLGNHYQTILDILEDKNGNLWFSSWNGGGVWRYDARLPDGQGKPFKNYLPSADYYRRKEDRRSSDKKFLPTGPAFFNQALLKDTITDDMIFSIFEDKAGNLWFATRNHGACRYDGKSFVSFREQEGFVSTGVYCILEDQKGNMWFTTDKSGVFCYDGKTFKNFTTNDGLVYNSVFSILEDKNGNLWFGTRGFGLSRYDGKTFTTFSE